MRLLVLLPVLAAAAASGTAAPPLSKSFKAKAPASAPATPSSAGIVKPQATAPTSGSPAPAGGPNRTVVPEGVAHDGPTTSSSYKISPGDAVDIYVWGDDRLQRALSVLPDGTFAFPLAGTIHAAGKTPNQIEAELSGLLASQYKGVAPQVTVSVRQPSGMMVSIIGKVRSPSTIAPTRYVTVLDALALVGGPSDFADIKNIVVMRQVDGKTTVLRTKLAGAFKGKPGQLDDASNPPLQAGDTVVVP